MNRLSLKCRHIFGIGRIWPPLLFLSAMTCGCSSQTRILDLLPPDAPKGYVEFYRQWPQDGGDELLLVPICEVWRSANGTETRLPDLSMGRLGDKMDHDQRLIIAEPPGDHTYIVRLPSEIKVGAPRSTYRIRPADYGDRRVTVSVTDGNVTPVRIKVAKAAFKNVFYDPGEGDILLRAFTRDAGWESVSPPLELFPPGPPYPVEER